MRVITLLTDFGQDYFVGIMKGVILKINPQANIVDITHNIAPQDIKGAAFVLLVSYNYFPPQTIHVVVVDPGVGTERKVILIKTKNYFFLAPDNGVLSFILEREEVEKVLEVKEEKFYLKPVSQTFWGRDVFAPVSAYLSKGIPLLKFGNPMDISTLRRISFPSPVYEKEKARGEIIYVDRFGNLVTNFSCSEFLSWIGKRRFILYVGKKKVTSLFPSYQQGREEEIFLLCGSHNFIEITSFNQSAQLLTTATCGDSVKVDLL